MKILLCNTTDTGGGATKASYRLLESFSAKRIDARLLVMHKHSKNPSVLNVFDFHKKRSALGRYAKFLEYKLRNQIRKRKWSKYPDRQTNITLDDITFSHLENSLEKIDFDILHLHWVEGEFINFKDLQKIKKPIVWTLHGCFPFTGICHFFSCNDENYKKRCGRCPILKSNRNYDLSTEIFLAKMARYKNLNIHIVCPSKWLAGCAKASALLGERPIHVIPNAIDTELFSPIKKNIAREALKLKKDGYIILFGAVAFTSDKRKGYLHLQKALQILKNKDLPEGTELLVFGASNYDRQKPSDIQTTYLDYISNDRLLAITYSAADVMVVPSTHENLPYTIMESLSCGTPVVCFDIGGNSDMLDHKRNGYLARPFDAEDLARGIRWCLENKQKNNLGQNARQKVLGHYRKEIVAMKHIELYRALLNSGKKE